MQLVDRTATLQNKPFWIWDLQKHKQEDVRTKGECIVYMQMRSMSN
jgi:hypothetical protein